MMTVNAFWFGFLIGVIFSLVVLFVIAYTSYKAKKGDKDDNGNKG